MYPFPTQDNYRYGVRIDAYWRENKVYSVTATDSTRDVVPGAVPVAIFRSFPDAARFGKEFYETNK